MLRIRKVVGVRLDSNYALTFLEEDNTLLSKRIAALQEHLVVLVHELNAIEMGVPVDIVVEADYFLREHIVG